MMEKKSSSFYLLDYKNADDMLISSLKHLMRPKYQNYKVYIHIFYLFDAIILLRIISELTIIPIKQS